MEVSAPPDTGHLQALSSTLSFRSYVREMWRRRDFLIVVPRQDARAKQMTNLLGQAWHLLNPALMILVYYLIFGVLLDGSRGVEHYVSFLTTGILLFQLLQRTVVDSSMCMHRHEGLIRSIQFPRALLVLSTVVEQLVAFVPTMLLLYVVAWIDGVPPRLAMLAFPLAVAILTLLIIGFSLIAARVGAGLPDLKDILPHLLRLLLYGSGVVFSIDALVSTEWIRTILKLNPIAGALSLARWSMLGMPLDAMSLFSLLTWATVVPIFGFWFFKRREHVYGR